MYLTTYSFIPPYPSLQKNEGPLVRLHITWQDKLLEEAVTQLTIGCAINRRPAHTCKVHKNITWFFSSKQHSRPAIPSSTVSSTWFGIFSQDSHHRENWNLVSGTIHIIDFMCPKEAEIKTRWKIACHFKCKVWQEKHQPVSGWSNCSGMPCGVSKAMKLKLLELSQRQQRKGKESMN